MRCCERCFNDEYLNARIREGGRVGSCQFCRSRRVPIIDTSELQPLFVRFTEIYAPVQPGVNVAPDADVLRIGDQLVTLIQDQWELFSERLLASGREHDLLGAIMTANHREEEILDAPAVLDLWTDHDWLGYTLLDRWYEICDRLKHPKDHVHVAPGAEPTAEELACPADTFDWFENDVDRASMTLPAGSSVFRVRVGYREKDYRRMAIPAPEMGA